MAKLLAKNFYKQILITYELVHDPAQNKLHSRLKELMRSKGYEDFMTGTNAKGEQGRIRLPSCTLWKANIDVRDAKNELREAAKFCGATIELCIAAEVNEWSAIAHKSVS